MFEKLGQLIKNKKQKDFTSNIVYDIMTEDEDFDLNMELFFEADTMEDVPDIDISSIQEDISDDELFPADDSDDTDFFNDNDVDIDECGGTVTENYEPMINKSNARKFFEKHF